MLWWRNNRQPYDDDPIMVEFEQGYDDDGDGDDTDDDSAARNDDNAAIKDDSNTWQQHQLHDGNQGEGTRGQSQNRG